MTKHMRPRDKVRGTAIACSAQTEGHPTGQVAAVARAARMRTVVKGADLEATGRQIADGYPTLPKGKEIADAISRAHYAPQDGRETPGGGWEAEAALAIAHYACLVGRDLEHSLQIAVIHSDDSDCRGDDRRQHARVDVSSSSAGALVVQ